MASSNSEGPGPYSSLIKLLIHTNKDLNENYYTGAPLATFLLASSSERSPPSRCRLWLPIDLMFGLRCQAGAIMLVNRIEIIRYIFIFPNKFKYII